MILSMELPFGHIKEPSYLIFSEPTIVAQIETEQSLVNASKELIRIFEDKIKATINRVWGDSEEKTDQFKEHESITLLAGGSGRKLGDG